MAADPKFSAGAREERRTVLAFARRLIKRTNAVADGTSGATVAAKMIAYLETRQKRYDKKPGGLGAK